jgi:hypothetical protein
MLAAVLIGELGVTALIDEAMRASAAAKWLRVNRRKKLD